MGSNVTIDTAPRMGAGTAAEVRWGIDDVDGRLAEPALPCAPPVIRLDMPWKICREGLSMHALRRRAIGVPSALRQWADAFRRRRTSSPFDGQMGLLEMGLLKEACRAEMAGTVGVETDALSATLTRAVP